MPLPDKPTSATRLPIGTQIQTSGTSGRSFIVQSVEDKHRMTLTTLAKDPTVPDTLPEPLVFPTWTASGVVDVIRADPSQWLRLLATNFSFV